MIISTSWRQSQWNWRALICAVETLHCLKNHEVGHNNEVTQNSILITLQYVARESKGNATHHYSHSNHRPTPVLKRWYESHPVLHFRWIDNDNSLMVPYNGIVVNHLASAVSYKKPRNTIRKENIGFFQCQTLNWWIFTGRSSGGRSRNHF